MFASIREYPRPAECLPRGGDRYIKRQQGVNVTASGQLATFTNFPQVDDTALPGNSKKKGTQKVKEGRRKGLFPIFLFTLFTRLILTVICGLYFGLKGTAAFLVYSRFLFFYFIPLLATFV